MERLRKHIEQITPLGDEEFNYIQSSFAPKRVRKHQFLIHGGDEVNYEFLVLSGIYKVFYVDGQGKEFITMFAKEDWWTTDYSAFFQQTKATMFVECIEAGEVLFSTLGAREKLSSEYHKMEHFFRVKLTNRHIVLQERVKLLLSSSPLGTFRSLLKIIPRLIAKTTERPGCKIFGREPRNPKPPLFNLNNDVIWLTFYLWLRSLQASLGR